MIVNITSRIESTFTVDSIQCSRSPDGKIPAFVTVFCNLVHENITWSVGIAQTEEFMISL